MIGRLRRQGQQNNSKAGGDDGGEVTPEEGEIKILPALTKVDMPPARPVSDKLSLWLTMENVKSLFLEWMDVG